LCPITPQKSSFHQSFSVQLEFSLPSPSRSLYFHNFPDHHLSFIPFHLSLYRNGISDKTNTNVDEFAKILKREKLTHGKVMTSLASKILLLNNPWEILPIDSLVKKTFNLKTNNYKDYQPLIKKYISSRTSLISDYLEKTSLFNKTIENEFKNEIRNIEMIRVNRFIDKMLWAEGKNI
jgi:hypothetical protein